MTSTKRKIRERRSFAKSARFPLTDQKGCIVAFNRSIRADRRLNNIKMHLIHPDDPGSATEE